MSDTFGLSQEERQLFLDEMGEHLDTLETELLDLERGGATEEQIAMVFRAAHTIKGGAATVGFDGMARMTHSMETLFDQMRSGAVVPSFEAMSPILQAVDLLREMLNRIAVGHDPGMPPAELLAELVRIGSGAAAAVQAPTAPVVASPSSRTTSSQGDATGAIKIRIHLNIESAMPAVRSLQVFLALEGLGQIVSASPTQADIEAEQVQEWMVMELVTDKPAADVSAVLARIPDLIEVTVEPNAAALKPKAGEGNPSGNPTQHKAGEDRTIRVDVALLDQLMNLVGELVIDRGRLAGIMQDLSRRDGAHDIAEELGRVTGHLSRLTGTLQDAVLKARMLPVERTFKKFPRMVRDVAQTVQKLVDFQTAGEETELDRSLLEVIGDALMHLLRNSLDHGLESPEERRKAGKPETGRLLLAAAHEENHVVITVQDDGRGIDAERVRAAAVRKGLLSAERARELTEKDAIQLLFASGFSTAETVTDISGRGVGLDVVRRNIERVGGRVDVETKIGHGTTFRLMLPLTLATVRALLVQVEQDTLAIPLTAVAEALRIEPADISTVQRRHVARVRGRVVPLVWMAQFMERASRPERVPEAVLVVLVQHKGELMGLVVDGLLGEQEVVVKGLGDFFGQVRGISGVTILADGNPALIADVGGIISALAAEEENK